MEAAAANDLYDELHQALPWHDGTFNDWQAKRSESAPYHYRAGVTVWVAAVDLDPEGTYFQRDDQGEAVSDDGHSP